MFNFFKTEPKKYSNLSAEAFNKAMNSNDAVLIDVRSANEFRSGKIKGARNIDVMNPDFPNQIKHLSKDKQYFVYCRSGGRSGQACSIMADQGFEKIYNLSSGVSGWPYGLE
jgi:rhodanese-related sulfurtransferase